MDLVFDIETDDLQATLVHCIVAQDAETGEIFKFPPHKLEEGYKFLATADRLIGHNIIGFDIPMVQKFGGVDPITLPFDYGEYPEIVNPADGMGWDIIIVPGSTKENKDLISYSEEIENDMYSFIQKKLQAYLPEIKIFHCSN